MSFITGHPYVKRMVNGFLFYKRRWYVFGVFSTFYCGVLYKFRNHQNEIARMALAGSLSNMICEVGFHFADTVNIRAKLHTHNVSTSHMLSQIFMEEGLYGLSKGITA